MRTKSLWMAIVKYEDRILFRGIRQSEYQAEKSIVDYLRRNKDFEGRDFDQACFWIGEKNLGLDLIVFSMQPEDFQEVRDQLALFRTDLPLMEKGLYRVIYEIDVGANSALHAARQVHEIMSDPESMPPVLDIIDNKGNKIRIDLSHQKRKRIC